MFKFKQKNSRQRAYVAVSHEIPEKRRLYELVCLTERGEKINKRIMVYLSLHFLGGVYIVVDKDGLIYVVQYQI